MSWIPFDTFEILFSGGRLGKLSVKNTVSSVYSSADELWESFQEGISNFANDEETGVSSIINTPIKKRLKVTQEILSILKQFKPINQVPCGN